MPRSSPQQPSQMTVWWTHKPDHLQIMGQAVCLLDLIWVTNLICLQSEQRRRPACVLKTSRALSYTWRSRRVAASFRPTPSAHVVQTANVLDPWACWSDTDGGLSSWVVVIFLRIVILSNNAVKDKSVSCYSQEASDPPTRAGSHTLILWFERLFSVILNISCHCNKQCGTFNQPN